MENAYLFELDAYSPPKKRGRREPLPQGVRVALARVKRALDAIPPEEAERRRRRWREMNESVRPL